MYLLEVVVNLGNKSTHSRSFTWHKFDLIRVFSVLDKKKKSFPIVKKTGTKGTSVCKELNS